MPIRLYDALDIDPTQQQVADGILPEQANIGLGLRRLLGNTLWGVGCSGLAALIHFGLDDAVMNDAYDEPWLTLAGITWLVAGICILTMLPTFVWSGIKSLRASARAQSLSSPEATVTSFFRAILNELPEQAFVLLTVQAQNQARLELSEPVALRDILELPEFTDADGLGRYWSPLVVRELEAAVERAEVDHLEPKTARVHVPLTMDYPDRKKSRLEFPAEFIAVERNGRWYLANGFAWPTEPIEVPR